MAIIVTVFAIFSATITNITTGDTGYAQTTVLFQINRMADEIKTTGLFIDEQEIVEDITYNKSFKKYEGSDNLIQFTITAKTKDDKTIYEHNELIIKNDDKN
ncbi:MAG TPA: hypothetical protein VKG26_00540 [Bacteroidia bacterium]|nr:hypothetical protein [Bacteroidia bacterium]